MDRILLDVSNQAIFWQLKLGIGQGTGGSWETDEKLMIPGSRTLVRVGIVGIRIRAAVPGSELGGNPQAVVTVEAVT